MKEINGSLSVQIEWVRNLEHKRTDVRERLKLGESAGGRFLICHHTLETESKAYVKR